MTGALSAEQTEYRAPEQDKKWRARELFGFMWRHLNLDIPPGYRDVMLFLIEKTNAATGQVNWRQSKMAKALLLSGNTSMKRCDGGKRQRPIWKLKTEEILTA